MGKRVGGRRALFVGVIAVLLLVPAILVVTQSRTQAASTVLTVQFGILSFTDTTHTDHRLVPPQSPRSFDSFDEAADEAAISRMYGGIHYAFDNNDGLASGRCIGGLVAARVRFEK